MWVHYGCLQPVPILCHFASLDMSEYTSNLLCFGGCFSGPWFCLLLLLLPPHPLNSLCPGVWYILPINHNNHSGHYFSSSYTVQSLHFELNTCRGCSIQNMTLLISCQYFPTFDAITHIPLKNSWMLMTNSTDHHIAMSKIWKWRAISTSSYPSFQHVWRGNTRIAKDK